MCSALPSLKNVYLQQYKAPHHVAGSEAQPQLITGALHFLPLMLRFSFYRKESQTLENNFRKILLLIEQIDVLKALLRDTKDGTDNNHSWNAHGVPVEDPDHTEVLDEARRVGRDGVVDSEDVQGDGEYVLPVSHPLLLPMGSPVLTDIWFMYRNPLFHK